MSRILGRGRYIYGTYPSGPGGGGGAGAASVPLSRQRFIDGDTAQAGLTGSAAEPFKTIAQFVASRGPVSIADATANYVGWLMPTLAGYTESVALPPNASTELRADSISIVAGEGAIITGNVTWANTAAAPAASGSSAVIHNISVTGSVTVTDVPASPPSVFVFGGDEIGNQSAALGGGFVSNATTRLSQAIFYNTQIAGINAGVAATSAVVFLRNCAEIGDIAASVFLSENSTIDAGLITISALGSASFVNTLFFAGSAPTLTAVGGSAFDALSWQSFTGAGGTRAAGTPVLVTGGYSGASVEGADLTVASTDVSLNGFGATAAQQGANSGNHYSTSNGTPTSVTLKTGGGELNGDTMLITKQDLGANVLVVKNNAGGTIGTIPTLARGFVLARFSTALNDWAFVEGGSMLA